MNNSINIYIVEDMAIARASLETMLLENNYKLAGSAAKAETALEELRISQVDLLLLDINLAGEKSGIWLAKQVRQFLDIPIIYLTAYGDQQTLKEVLDTKPNGYLMKPYQEPALLTAIKIALDNYSVSKIDNIKTHSEAKHTEFIFIKDKSLKVKLKTTDILFVKSEGNYLEIKLENKTHVVRSKLSDFKTLLPDVVFFRSHQRYLVNINKIDLIGKDFVNVSGQDIPLSLKYKKTIEDALSIS